MEQGTLAQQQALVVAGETVRRELDEVERVAKVRDWWCLVVLGGAWWCMVVHGGTCWYMLVALVTIQGQC